MYLMRRGSRLTNVFYWPTLDLLTWGFITVYLNNVGKSGFNFLTAILSAVLLWNFFIRAQLGFHMAFLEDVWERNFLNIFVTRITIPMNTLPCHIIPPFLAVFYAAERRFAGFWFF